MFAAKKSPDLTIALRTALFQFQRRTTCSTGCRVRRRRIPATDASLDFEECIVIGGDDVRAANGFERPRDAGDGRRMIEVVRMQSHTQQSLTAPEPPLNRRHGD